MKKLGVVVVGNHINVYVNKVNVKYNSTYTGTLVKGYHKKSSKYRFN
jgi:hypothetical protein